MQSPLLKQLDKQFKLLDLAKQTRLQLKEIRNLQKEFLISSAYMEAPEIKWLENPSIPEEDKELLLRTNKLRKLFKERLHICIDKLCLSLDIKLEDLEKDLVICHFCNKTLLKSKAETGKEEKGKFFFHKECFEKNEYYSDRGLKVFKKKEAKGTIKI